MLSTGAKYDIILWYINAGVVMQLNTTVASDVQVSPECLFLPADAGLFVTDSDLNFEAQDMRELAAPKT